MAALRFDGTDDRLRWTTLASALSNVSDGAWTSAFVFKRANTTGDALEGLGYLLAGAGNGTAEAGLSILQSNGTLAIDIDAGVTGGPAVTSTTETYMGVASKASGTVAPIMSRYIKSTNAWTHITGGSTLANQSVATMLELGSWQGAFDFFDGWMGIAAFWEGAMTQAHKEALVTNWRTSDLWGSAHGQPAFLAELDVAGASIVDLASNASSLTATGTTLDTNETLASWNFDGIGGSGAAALELAMLI